MPLRTTRSSKTVPCVHPPCNSSTVRKPPIAAKRDRMSNPPKRPELRAPPKQSPKMPKNFATHPRRCPAPKANNQVKPRSLTDQSQNCIPTTRINNCTVSLTIKMSSMPNGSRFPTDTDMTRHVVLIVSLRVLPAAPPFRTFEARAQVLVPMSTVLYT